MVHVLMKPRLAFMAILAVIILPVAPTASQQAETEDQSTPYYRLPLIITSAFRESEGFFSTVEEITAQDLLEQDAATVAEALDLLPGLRTGVTRVGHGAYVTWRGFEQHHLLIVIDETPLYGPYDGLLELDQLPVDQIQTIRVIKGSTPLHYGPNALGGVIHIVTRDPTSTPSADAPSNIASISFSENTTYGLRLGTGWHLGPWRFSLSGTRDRSDGFRLAADYQEVAVPDLSGEQESLPYEDGGWRDNSDHDRNAARLNGSYIPNDRFRLDLFASLVDSRWGIPTHPIYNPEKDRSRVRYWRFEKWQQALSGLTASGRLNDRTWIQACLHYTAYNNVLDGYDDDSFSSQNRPYAFRSIYDDHSLGSRLRLDVIPGRVGRITAAAGLTEDVHRDTPDRGEATDEYRQRTWWWSLEDQVSLKGGLSINVGCSASWLQKIRRAGQLDAGDNLLALNTRLSLATLISRSLRLYLTGARLTRFPTMKQLYGTDGNPDLKEQRSYHLELGGAGTLMSQLQAQGSIFFDRMKNLIEGNYTSPALLNISKASIVGGELNLDADPFDGWHVQLSYTHLWAKNRSPNRPGDDLQYRPRHQLDWHLRADLLYEVRLHVSGSAVSRRYFYNDFYHGRRDHLAAHVAHHLMLQKTLSFGLIPFVAVENLLDTPYSHVYTSPAPGRQIRAGLRISW
jgi:outer membrane cobalamin receptor